MKKAVISLLLTVTVALSGVPAMAENVTDSQTAIVETAEESAAEVTEEIEEAEEEQENSFNAALADLYDRSMSITDEEILKMAETMDSDFTALEGREDAEDLIGLIKSFETEKVQFMLGTSELGYEGSVGSDVRRQKHLSEFSLGAANELVRLLPRVQVRDLTETENGLSLTIYEWNTEGYSTGASDAVSACAYGYTYTLNLQKDGAAWSLAGITGTEENYESLANEGVIFTADGISYEEVEDDTAIEEENDDLVGTGLPANYTFTYDADAAIAYADKWVFGKNPDYDYFGGQGGDCANFVSQSLYAGGLPLTDKWNAHGRTDEQFRNWVNNSDLHKYLTNNGFGSYITDPKAEQIDKGDLIFYNWNPKKSGRTQHVTIVVGKDASGEPLIDSHTTDHYHWPWKYGSSTTVYTAFLMKKSNTDKSEDLVSTAVDDQPKDRVIMYRVYNPNTGEHFYTGNAKERVHLVNVGWKDEGLGWYAAASSKTPIYRLYNENAGDHHYTTNKKERDNLISVGWKDEGILGYSDDNKGVSIYRQYNENAKTGAHNFTQHTAERDNLVRVGWKDEKVAWYGVAAK